MSTFTHRPTIRAKKYLVSSVHYLASMAGMQILERGGNAADAGVAVGLCINVLETELVHFGGVAPIIYCPGSGGPVETISGLGRWPQASSLDYFRQHHDNDMSFGVLRCVTPAAPDAWLTALARFGTMTFAEVVQPALDLAENGRSVDQRFLDAISHDETLNWPSTAEIFRPNGRFPQLGDLHFQKDLARTFRRLIAAEALAGGGREAGLQAARDLVYKGEIAEEMIAFHQEQGGLLTLDDLANFSVQVEPPAHIHYKGYDVYSCGAWCQGPAFLMLLKLLEGVDLVSMGHNSTDYLHTLVEAVKLVMADREAFIGDPEFVQVPLAGLLDGQYWAERRQAIEMESAMPNMPASGNPWPHQAEPRGEWGPLPKTFGTNRVAAPPTPERDTSYVSVVDQWGNTFSATPSDGFGSSPIVPGLGFPISARGSQSWLENDHPSSVAAGKRPRLTPNPALVLKNGRPVMAIGTPGADAQIQAMAQVFLNMVEFGMEPQAAIEAPRIISRSFPQTFWPHESYPAEAIIETRISAAVRDEMRQRGHVLLEDGAWSKKVSRVCTIVTDPETGTKAGGADPRTTGYAVGW
ncbi:MAG: gamma-glutamyltransferase family protein [Chloroflexota bacterium]